MNLCSCGVWIPNCVWAVFVAFRRPEKRKKRREARLEKKKQEKRQKKEKLLEVKRQKKQEILKRIHQLADQVGSKSVSNICVGLIFFVVLHVRLKI